MVTKDSVYEIFAKMREDPENSNCFECGSKNPIFTSISNGCLICDVCAPLHSALGDSISLVKAIDSEWSERELKQVIIGGNTSLKEFFTYYNINNTPLDFKYLTKAAYFYREMLFVEAQDKEFEDFCPSLKEGAQLVSATYSDQDQIELPNPPIEETKIEETKTEPKKTGMRAWARRMLGKAVDAGNKASDKIGEKLNKLSLDPTIKRIENKTIRFAGKVERGLTHVFNNANTDPGVQNEIPQVINETESIIEEVNITYNHFKSNKIIQNLKIELISMLNDRKESLQRQPSFN